MGKMEGGDQKNVLPVIVSIMGIIYGWPLEYRQ